MFEYVIGYVICGVLFVVGAAGYWAVTRSLRDPAAIYESVEVTAPVRPSATGIADSTK